MVTFVCQFDQNTLPLHLFKNYLDVAVSVAFVGEEMRLTFKPVNFE